MDTPDFVCFRCNQRIPFDPESEAEAEAEMLMSYGRVLDPRERATLCDDCYGEFREWQRAMRRRDPDKPSWPLPPRLMN